jgi:hypothetical protein
VTGKSWIMREINEQDYQKKLMYKIATNNLVVRKLVQELIRSSIMNTMSAVDSENNLYIYTYDICHINIPLF